MRRKRPKKHTVLTLVERDGESHSFHIANVKAKTLRETIVRVADRKSHLVTDEHKSYADLGWEFASHSTVNHSANEYVWADFAHVNTAEARFSLMKRAIFGAHHSISEAHLAALPHGMGFQVEYPQDERRGTCGARAQRRGR